MIIYYRPQKYHLKQMRSSIYKDMTLCIWTLHAIINHIIYSTDYRMYVPTVSYNRIVCTYIHLNPSSSRSLLQCAVG